MFSFSKPSFESKLLKLLQNKFFKTSKRNKILAKWAAGRLGYDENKTNSYIRSLVLSYLVSPSDTIILNKVAADFQKSGISISILEIEQKMKAIEDRIDNKDNYAAN